MSTSILHVTTRPSRAMIMGGLLAGFVLAVSASSCESQSDPSPATSSADERPVILLTGFKPFGRRSENASWEGVKSLDGREFHGHRIVCRQLPVVWGAPLENLRKWTEDLHPVAVFSFGEGGPDGFSIETLASNRRGQFRDNNNATPASSSIVADGPDHFDATIEHDALRDALATQGHPVRISTNAGHYLCEECLYSLEYLRSTEGPNINVMFCHVPPMGSEIGGQRVSADFVQDYVEDLLENWYALSNPADLTAGAESDSGTGAESSDPRQAAVETFIKRYFSSWSDRDMETYGDCFATGSCVQYVAENDQIHLYQREPFLDLQTNVHRQSRTRLRETPESIDIRFERDLARVVVHWKLVAGNRTEFGYDHFTLFDGSDGWKILNLVFYSTPPAGN
jgi:pyroglutamyl-peptidase